MMAAAGVPVLDELDPDTVTADQLPVLIKASAWRRPRYAGGARTVELPRGGGRPSRGAVGVRRPDRVLRALPGHRPPRRGPGARRRARHRVGGRRTRMLDPAAPEDHRGGAVAARRTHCRHAAKLFDAGAGRDRHRLHRRGHRRVHGRRQRRLLLPGDEHPAAGRASGHRTHHRPRPRRAATARRRRRPPRPDRRRRGYSIEAACTPRTGQGLAAAGRLLFDVYSGTQFRPRHARCARRHRHRRRLEVSVFYDPMLAKIISYAPTRRQAAGTARRRAGPHPHPRRAHQPDLLVNVLRHRRSSTAPPTPRSSTPTAWPNWPRRWPSRASRLGALAAALADAARNRRSATVFAAAPSGWRNLASGFQTKQYRDSAGEVDVATGSPARRGGARLRRRDPGVRRP